MAAFSPRHMVASARLRPASRGCEPTKYSSTERAGYQPAGGQGASGTRRAGNHTEPEGSRRTGGQSEGAGGGNNKWQPAKIEGLVSTMSNGSCVAGCSRDHCATHRSLQAACSCCADSPFLTTDVSVVPAVRPACPIPRHVLHPPTCDLTRLSVFATSWRLFQIGRRPGHGE